MRYVQLCPIGYHQRKSNVFAELDGLSDPPHALSLNSADQVLQGRRRLEKSSRYQRMPETRGSHTHTSHFTLHASHTTLSSGDGLTGTWLLCVFHTRISRLCLLVRHVARIFCAERPTIIFRAGAILRYVDLIRFDVTGLPPASGVHVCVGRQQHAANVHEIFLMCVQCCSWARPTLDRRGWRNYMSLRGSSSHSGAAMSPAEGESRSETDCSTEATREVIRSTVSALWRDSSPKPGELSTPTRPDGLVAVSGPRPYSAGTSPRIFLHRRGGKFLWTLGWEMQIDFEHLSGSSPPHAYLYHILQIMELKP